MSRHCVVIGSGLGGLSSALMMARAGYRVTVVEQQRRIGGCLQCFTRDGQRFETGMHYIGSAAPGQTLDRILRCLGVRDDIELSQLDTSGYDTISIRDLGTYRIANGREAFVETLSADFSGAADHLARYHDTITQLAEAWSIDNLPGKRFNPTISSHYLTVSVDKALDELIPDPALRDVLAGNLPLYAGQAGRTPFALHAFITDFYNRSAWRITGGSDRLSDAMARRLLERGATIRTCARVTRIICDNTRATGIEINGSEFMPADIIIATQHPASAVDMTDSPMLRPAYRRRIASLADTIGCFTLYLTFKPGSVRYLNTNIFNYICASPWESGAYTADDWPRSYLYMHPCTGHGQQYATNGTVIAYMRWHDVKRWENTVTGHRGHDYELFKKHHADRLTAALLHDRPELEGCILATHASTPLTWRDYTGTRHGSMYGIAGDVTAGIAGRIHNRLRVPNIILAGQSVNSHGILGTLISSMLAVSAGK